MSGEAVTLRFQVGARTLLAVRKALVRVPLGLDDALDGRLPVLPPLEGAEGYSITSLPAERQAAMVYASGGMTPLVRQGYTRYFASLEGGFDAYLAGLSANTRQGLKRKAKKIASASGGAMDIRRFRSAEELERFHPIARAISARTYQEKLLDAGLPEDAGFVAQMLRGAAADGVRAWLLYIGDQPAAYLYCPARGDTLIYEYVGHDPAYNDLSPGAVLQMEAMRDLFAEGRFARFDFTEGEGQHKRAMATGGVACVDMLLLRPTLANRAVLLGLGGFNRGVALAKHAAERLGVAQRMKGLRRG